MDPAVATLDLAKAGAIIAESYAGNWVMTE
jgi:hypothetical protein